MSGCQVVKINYDLSRLRDCCTQALARHQPLIVGGQMQLNGVPFVVQADETMAHHAQRVCFYSLFF